MALAEFFSVHTVLTGSLILALIAMAMIAHARPNHRFLILSGFLAAPFSLLSFLFVPHYWNPPFVAHFICSPEEIIFSASTGIMAFYFAGLPYGHKLRTHVPRSVALKRFLVWVVAGTLLFSLFFCLLDDDSMVMHATLAAMILVGLALLWKRRDMLPAALSACLGFTVLYTVGLVLLRALLPGVFDAWTAPGQLSFDFWGLPAFEILWAAAYGFGWPLFFCHVFDLRRA